MRKDHRPYFIQRLQRSINHWYIDHYVRPQFDKLGANPMVLKPRSVQLAGRHIHAGHFLHLISDRQKPVKLTTWSSRQGQAAIHIGDYALISPGVEISAALSITIGNNCMIAADCVITDSDWHGLYNRLRPFRCTRAVTLDDNVWVGRGAFIGKGVHIGKNSVIGAHAVVTQDVPENTVYAGNPARLIKHINPKRRMLKREFLFQQGDYYWQQQEEINQYLAANNSLMDWFRTLVAPCTKD